MEAQTVVTSDGWPLHVQRIRHPNPSGVVILGHAMFCNSSTLDRRGKGLAWVFHSQGYEVWNADLRGHGQSGPGAASGGLWCYDDIVEYDVSALVTAARLEMYSGPLVWLGHSLGAHAAIAALSLNPALLIDAVISLAGGVWISKLEPNPLRWAMKLALFEAWLGISVGVGYCPSGRIGFGTDDEAVPYVRQLVMNGRRNEWRTADRSFDYLSGMRWIDVPILNVVGAADTYMCHPVCAREWLGYAQRALVSHRIVGARPNDPQGIDHMGLAVNTTMKPIWTEIATWALTVTKR